MHHLRARLIGLGLLAGSLGVPIEVSAQIGKTLAECSANYGMPAEARPGGLWDIRFTTARFIIDALLKNERCHQIKYQSRETLPAFFGVEGTPKPLNEQQVLALLLENSGGADWIQTDEWEWRSKDRLMSAWFSRSSGLSIRLTPPQPPEDEKTREELARKPESPNEKHARLRLASLREHWDEFPLLTPTRADGSPPSVHRLNLREKAVYVGNAGYSGFRFEANGKPGQEFLWAFVATPSVKSWYAIRKTSDEGTSGAVWKPFSDDGRPIVEAAKTRLGSAISNQIAADKEVTTQRIAAPRVPRGEQVLMWFEFPKGETVAEIAFVFAFGKTTSPMFGEEWMHWSEIGDILQLEVKPK